MTKPRLLITEPDAYSTDQVARLKEEFEVHLATPVDTAAFRILLHSINPDALLVGLGLEIGEAECERAPRLRIVACPATGVEHVDVEALGRRGTTFISLRGRSSELSSVSGTAELAWALLLALARRLPAAHHSVTSGNWRRSDFQGIQLRGKCIAVIGHGRLGAMVAEFGRAFAMKVLIVDPEPKGRFSVEEICSMDAAVQKADVISLHVPLTDQTRTMVNAALLARTVRAPLLINTSRGEIVDESAVASAIRDGVLAGYGTDVIAGDTSWGAHTARNPITPLISEGFNVVITPHIGGYTTDAMSFTRELIVNDVLAELRRATFTR